MMRIGTAAVPAGDGGSERRRDEAIPDRRSGRAGRIVVTALTIAGTGDAHHARPAAGEEAGGAASSAAPSLARPPARRSGRQNRLAQ